MSMASAPIILAFGSVKITPNNQRQILNHVSKNRCFGEIFASQESEVSEKARAENPGYRFSKSLEILNMGLISFNKHEIDILDF